MAYTIAYTDQANKGTITVEDKLQLYIIIVLHYNIELHKKK